MTQPVKFGLNVDPDTAGLAIAERITTDRTIKMIGLGMAVAILIDALLIHTVLVPAVMHA